VSCFSGRGNKRSCTAVFCKNWGLHVRRLGVFGYRYIRGYLWIYPWISTENLWIWIWMGNFISTASLKIVTSCRARLLVLTDDAADLVSSVD